MNVLLTLIICQWMMSVVPALWFASLFSDLFYFHCASPPGAPAHSERVCRGGGHVLLQQAGEWGAHKLALVSTGTPWYIRPPGVCPKPNLSVSSCVCCDPQEEGDDDLMFKMVFVVNMDLAMGVGKVKPAGLLWTEWVMLLSSMCFS